MLTPWQKIRVRTLTANATLLYQICHQYQPPREVAELCAEAAHLLDVETARVLGASPGTTPPIRVTQPSPPGSPMLSAMSVTNMRQATKELLTSKDTESSETLVLLKESKELLAYLNSTWKDAPGRLTRRLLIAANQVERAIQNLEKFEQLRVNGMISKPLSSTSNQETSTNWNSSRTTLLPTPDIIDSLVCTENFEEDIQKTPPIGRKMYTGTEAIRAPEKPQKPSLYFPSHIQDSLFTYDPQPLDLWHGSPDYPWNTGA